MSQLQISSNAGTGTDMLSRLPPETLLHVMSFLPTKDIAAALQTGNGTLNETVSYHESYLCRPRIKREISRLANETNYVNLAGVPVNIAIRRYFTILCRTNPVIKFGLSLESSTGFVSRDFAKSYCKQNPEEFPDLLEMDVFTSIILAIDYWLQYGEFSINFMRPFKTHLLNALLDAIDETIPVSHRYDMLLAALSPWTTYLPETQVLQLFEEMRRTPIVRKSDVKGNAKGMPKRISYLLTKIVREQIDLPSKVSEFLVRLGMRHRMVQQAVRRYGSLEGVPKHGLMWTAMLEETVVIWY